MATLKPESSRLSVEQIYLRYQDQVARWSQRLGGRVGDVEDIVQEVFLTVWREQARVTSLERRDELGDPLERWLYRVTEHAVYNQRWRERWRRRFVRSGGSTGSGDSNRAIAELPSGTPDALDLLDQADVKVDVYGVLDRLSARYRSILILFELEEMSGEAIAALTGIKLATVWVRLHRARAKFLRELQRLSPELAGRRAVHRGGLRKAPPEGLRQGNAR